MNLRHSRQTVVDRLRGRLLDLDQRPARTYRTAQRNLSGPGQIGRAGIASAAGARHSASYCSDYGNQVKSLTSGAMEDHTMKHPLISAAVAALAVSAPVWAQPAPSTPPSASAPASAAPAGHTGSVTRAHHRRHAVQAARNPPGGVSADQLNQQELSTLQTSNPTQMNRMPAGGKATSGTTTH